MKRFLPIFLLLAGCFGGGSGDGSNFGTEVGANWAASLEGYALDNHALIVSNVVFPTTISLRPVGRELYAVFFDGSLEFQLFDPVFNLPVGSYVYPLRGFDNRRGVYYRYSSSQPFGVFAFDDWLGFYEPALGSTTIGFAFNMAPQGGFLLDSETAVLNWEADLHGLGSNLPFVVPTEAKLQGTSTVAVRILE
ncbi:MAG: hypothetical protein H8E31_14945 [Planctomycetes bacterium]|nr:hypothetical protein [Planctomycetota bacterium]